MLGQSASAAPNFVQTKIFLKPSGRLVGGLFVCRGREFF
jgi:hypothetical protein